MRGAPETLANFVSEGRVVQDKFSRLEAELEGELVERTDEIRCAMLALVAGTTFFMVGPPGVAKSMLARRVAARISECEFFDAQLDKMSTPEMLFGPWSLAAMRENRWERELSGTLATAHLAHLDEVFAAGAALLQGLHWALNERIYRHGTTVVDIPLSTVFCSANAVPTEPGLAAFWDRLILRRVLSQDMDAGSFMQMMRVDLVDKPDAVLSWSEVLEAQVAARRVVIPDEVLGLMHQIRLHLTDTGIYSSPRRMVAAGRVVQASAWLDERDEAIPTDLLCLGDIMWVTPDQAGPVAQTVNRFLKTSISPAALLLRDLRKMRGEIVDGLPERERLALAEEMGEKLRRARTTLETLERRERTGATKACGRLLDELDDLVLRRLFRSDPSAAS
jgi:MoxR-like ATPase